MKALIGAHTPIGEFLLTQGTYDYVIDPSNIELLRNKQFLEIVCTIADLPKKGTMAEEKDALRFEKLQETLSEVKTERFTLITSVEALEPVNGVCTENSPLLSPDNAPSPFIAHRIEFEKFVNLRFGRVLTVRLPRQVFSSTLQPGILADINSAEALAQYPADMPHQLFYLPSLTKDIATGWTLGFSQINLAPEPLTTIEIVREYAPDAISVLKNAEEGAEFPPIMESLSSIHWHDPAGYISPKATIIPQIKTSLALN